MTVGEEKNRENISFEVSKRERKINIQKVAGNSAF